MMYLPTRAPCAGCPSLQLPITNHKLGHALVLAADCGGTLWVDVKHLKSGGNEDVLFARKGGTTVRGELKGSAVNVAAGSQQRSEDCGCCGRRLCSIVVVGFAGCRSLVVEQYSISQGGSMQIPW